MWARIATFEGGDFDKLRELAETRMQGGSETPGHGVMVLANAERTKRQFITFFDSPEAIEAAEPDFERIGDEIPEEVRGRRIGVEQFEVVFEQMPQTTGTR
jgi:hypothetical protein